MSSESESVLVSDSSSSFPDVWSQVALWITLFTGAAYLASGVWFWASHRPQKFAWFGLLVYAILGGLHGFIVGSLFALVVAGMAVSSGVLMTQGAVIIVSFCISVIVIGFASGPKFAPFAFV